MRRRRRQHGQSHSQSRCSISVTGHQRSRNSRRFRQSHPWISDISFSRSSGPAPRLDPIDKPRRTGQTSSSRCPGQKDSTRSYCKRDGNSTDHHSGLRKRPILSPSPSTAQNRRWHGRQRTSQPASQTSASSAQAARREKPASVDTSTAQSHTGRR